LFALCAANHDTGNELFTHVGNLQYGVFANTLFSSSQRLLYANISLAKFSLMRLAKHIKPYKGGEMPVYLRITVDGVEKELSAKRSWEPSR
jgi:hypothetical protein